MIVNIHEAKTHFSKLIQQAMRGEEVIIAKGNRPLVVLRPIPQTLTPERGLNRGKITISADFNAPVADFDEYQ